MARGRRGIRRKQYNPQTIVWEAISGASIVVSDGVDTLQELDAQLAAVTIGVGVDPLNSLNTGRVINNRPGSDVWLAEKLLPGGPWAMDAAGVALAHEIGMDWGDVLVNEIDYATNYLHELIGVRPRTFAYPQHRHSLATMKALRDAGYIQARDGSWGYEPTAGSVIGTGIADADVARTWAKWPVFSGLLQAYFNSPNFKGLSKSAMEAILYFTTANQTSPASQLFGYADLMAAWKGLHTWVHLYYHDESDLSGADVQALMEIFRDDGDFWVATAGEIAEYAHDRHAAFGAAENSEWVYEPLAGYAAADDAGLPWNGKKAAITFSTDDGTSENISVYLPVALATGVPYTAYITTQNIAEEGGGQLTRAEILTLHKSGMVEIGCHSKTHGKMIPDRACRLKSTVLRFGKNRGVKIVDGFGVKTIGIYQQVPWFDAIRDLTGFECLMLSEVADETMADGVDIASLDDVDGSVGPFISLAGDNQPTFRLAELGINSAIYHDGNDILYDSSFPVIGHNTNGITLFGVVRSAEASGVNSFFSQTDSAGASRLFRMSRDVAWIYDGLGGYATCTWPGGFVQDQWHIVIATWKPSIDSGNLRCFLDGYSTPGTPAGSAWANALNATPTAPARIGCYRHSTSNPWLGDWAALGAISVGYADGAAELQAIYNALNDKFKVV